MKQFSFFRDLRGGPGEIRGRQMADYFHGKINPESGYENDVCVYILGSHSREKPEPKYAYYDVIDCGFGRLSRIRAMTKGDIIAVSEVQYKELVKYYRGRKIYMIPQHHCNFNNELRPEKPVKVVGCIGGRSAVQWPHEEVGKMLEDVGLEWIFEEHYSKRRYAIEFYRKIDIQISYRPEHPRGIILHMNPLKLSNAGSFGIPTVAFPEPAYTESWKNECLWGDTIQDLVKQAKRLADDQELYNEYSHRVLERAKPYHIDNIAKLYMELPGGE